MRFSLTVHRVPWRAPLRSAHDPDPGARPLVLLRLDDGYGEAAPLASYDGVGVDRVLAALEAYRPTLEAYRPALETHSATPEAPAPEDHRAALYAACAALDPLPQALAAVDMALLDLAGQRAGQPVHALFGPRHPVSLNATIGASEPRVAALEAQGAVAAGFEAVKVKVGVGDDLARVAAVREAVGPSVALRLDANGAWGVDEAVEILRALEPLGIECCEEPVHGLQELASVSGSVDVAVAIDESMKELGSLERRWCTAACLKVSRSGGITPLLRDATAARAVGYELYLASTMDGPLGIAAALHAAACIGPDRPSGLATLGRFDRRVPEIDLDAPGLSSGVVDWYR